MKDNNFRAFKTSSGKIVLGGKSAENNERLVEETKPTEIVLHTEKPGSPFVNIKGKATKQNIKESAVFCAKYSKDWRDNKKDVLVHIFKGGDIYKNKSMKTGTFGVKKFKVIKVNKEDVLNFEKKLKDEAN